MSVVVGHVEADRVGHLDAGDVQWLRPGAGHHVAPDLGESAEVRGEGQLLAPRDVLAIRHRMPLGVSVPSPGPGQPHDALIEHLVARAPWAMPPTRIGTSIAALAVLIAVVDALVGERIDGRGVLGPHDEVRASPPRTGVPLGQLHGRVNMIRSDLPMVEEDVRAIPGTLP